MALTQRTGLRPTFTALLLLAGLVPAVAASEDGARGWGRYRDKESGVSFAFPAHIFPLASAAQAQNGVVFATPDGRARIRVFGFVNAARDTPGGYLRRIAKAGEGRFTYVRTTPRFFVASGTREGVIFYRRCNFSGGADNRVGCLQLDYPRSEKRAWDDVVTRISLSLRTNALE
jgi:hypothetical protein